jgi:hypothetical protein
MSSVGIMDFGVGGAVGVLGSAFMLLASPGPLKIMALMGLLGVG